jgi:hypothetical protein
MGAIPFALGKALGSWYTYSTFPMQPSPECPERRLLAQKVSETIIIVFSFRDKQPTKYADLPMQLNQARIAQRDAERALREHIKKHGCVPLKR